MINFKLTQHNEGSEEYFTYQCELNFKDETHFDKWNETSDLSDFVTYLENKYGIHNFSGGQNEDDENYEIGYFSYEIEEDSFYSCIKEWKEYWIKNKLFYQHDENEE